MPPGAYPSGGHAVPPMSGGSSSSAGGKYVYNEVKLYKLKEKMFSMSGDSFQVKDAQSGATAFKVKGNALSFGDSKKLLDPSGTPIYKMSESILSLRGRMQIVDSGTNKVLVMLRKKGFIPMLGTGTVQVWRGGSDEGPPWLQVKGDFFKRDFSMYVLLL